MADGRSVTTISEADYDAIERAVMETERGRWFLREYARRNRNADTDVLLEAIRRLEQAVAGERVAQDVERLRSHLREMATTITRTKAEIATIHAVEQEHSHLFAASEALDGITRTTEQATSDILAAAEHIQESAWTLREDGADPQICDDLDRRATEIYTACSFQDLTAQRIAKIIQTLRYLEGRINTMIAIWDETEGHLLPPAAPVALSQVAPSQTVPLAPPQAADLEPFDMTQSDIDSVIVDQDIFAARARPAGEWNQRQAEEPPSQARDFAQAENFTHVEDFGEPAFEGEADFALAEPEPAPAVPPRVSLHDDPDELSFVETGSLPVPAERHIRTEAFAEIDALPTREKLRLFT
jgi:chemotaxis regulatin CheY-phosphate phosphatase CheZ